MKINNRNDTIKLRNTVPKNIQKSEPFSEPQDRVSISSSKEKEWTVLFYLDGNSNLSRLSLGKLRDLEKSGSDENINLVAQVARPKKPLLDLISGDWSGVRRYYVTKNPDRQQLRSKEFQALDIGWRTKLFCKMAGDALKEGKERGLVSDGIIDKARFLHRAIEGSPYNSISSIISDTKDVKSDVTEELDNVPMSNPESLREFLNYPAKHYMVVLMDHGGGWTGAFTNDATASGGGIMTNPQIAEAFREAEKETGVKPDVVHMAACLMASTESAYELKDSAKYLVASEEMGTTLGFAYAPIVDKIQQDLADGKSVSARSVAKGIVEHYSDKPKAFPTKSAIDLSKMDTVKNALSDFAENLRKTDTDKELLKKLIDQAQNFSRKSYYEFYSHTRDLYSVAEQIARSKEVKDKDLKKSAKGIMSAVKQAVIANVGNVYERYEVMDTFKTTDGKEDVTLMKVYEGKFDTEGLSVYLPTSEKYVNYFVRDGQKYKELATSKETGWDEFLVEKFGSPKKEEEKTEEKKEG